MQVILLEKVVNLGQLGDVVKVKQGYARNFLIPQGKARRATETAIKEFETRRADLEKAQADKLAAAQAVQARLSGTKVQVTAKAGVDGRLFGSITNYDIAEALNSLSVAYAAEGDVEKALATIERALKLQPSPAMQKLLRQRRDLLNREP